MKTVQLTGLKEIKIINTDKPSIKNDNDVLIKVKRAGVCGSDMHYFNTGRIGSQIVKYPLVIGHEMSGIVEAIGSRVTRVKVNDMIAVDPLVYCGKCDQCLKGRHHTCRHQKFLGCPGQLDGCLKEFIVMPEYCCFKISSSMTLDQAVLCEPLSIGCHSVSFAGELKGKKIAVLGAGPIGLSVMIIAKASHAEKIYVTDLLDYRLKAALNNGADWIGNPQNTDCASDINRIEPEQLDYVFECCGKQEALNDAIKMLKPGGRLIIVGIPEFDDYIINAHLMRRIEINIQNVRRQNECMDKAIKLIADKIIDPDFMVTHHFPLSEASKAFELVSDYKNGIIKCLLDVE